MKKKSSLTAAKKRAWNQFSIYIRTRDCLKYSKDPTHGPCVTCKRDYPFKSLQAGHFIAGRTNSVLFDERGVHAQCYGCNVGRGGAHVEYFIFMEQEYGREVIDELRAKRHLNQKFTAEEYKATENYYKTKTQNLLDKA